MSSVRDVLGGLPFGDPVEDLRLASGQPVVRREGWQQVTWRRWLQEYGDVSLTGRQRNAFDAEPPATDRADRYRGRDLASRGVRTERLWPNRQVPHRKAPHRSRQRSADRSRRPRIRLIKQTGGAVAKQDERTPRALAFTQDQPDLGMEPLQPHELVQPMARRGQRMIR
jgi:hypothetical protein